MRKINSLADVQIVLNDLLNKEDYRQNHNRNTNGFQIKNTGPATDQTDVVILSQLHDYYDKRGGEQGVAGIGGSTGVGGFLGRIILPGVQTVANDILVNRYHVRLPRDENGVLLTNQIDLQNFIITAKIKPISPFVMRLNVSINQGISFQVLANNLTLPGGTETVTLSPTFNPAFLKDDYQITVDIVAADGTVSGIEGILQGAYSQ